MSATVELTAELQQQVRLLEADLRERVKVQPDVLAAWQHEHAEALARERTAAAWSTWRDDRVTQAAVAWVLTTVFLRFCEDNQLVRPVWIVGSPARRQEALDAQLAYFRVNPEHTDREWIGQGIAHLAALPATRDLVDDHAALRLVAPSGDAVSALIAFWRARDDDGDLLRDLADPDLSTRFLGDLYQDISPTARETYALLQTPIFVEEFILDRTLTPALNERPLERFKLIDPTCGSGHFLLGAFARLLDRWQRQAPGLERQTQVQHALDAVHGVDLNPFAVAIARFRLTLAAMRASGLRNLEDAPAFRIHLAVGDSLLHGAGQQTLSEDADVYNFGYKTENLDTLRELLQPGRYDAVVGNPPYIQVADPLLRKVYKTRYSSCHGEYALTVPFMERFYDLARRQEPSGWVGQITSNSFMTRGFGRKLVEGFLPEKDLRLLVDLSVAHVPGHGTPTIILIGRQASPVSPQLRIVMGIRREPGRQASADGGVVWRSILAHVDLAGWEDNWISVADLDRMELATHPWSLKGGGALGVQRLIERVANNTLSEFASAVGYLGVTGEDEAFVLPVAAAKRYDLPWRSISTGDDVRDYHFASHQAVLFPYDGSLELLPPERLNTLLRFMWPYRRLLQVRRRFGIPVEGIAGFAWYEFREFYRHRLKSGTRIAFAEVSTHNHFVPASDRYLKHSAPVIKLRDEYQEQMAGIVGYLNSSVVAFWLRQVCYDKGAGGISEGAKDEGWERFHAFNSTNIGKIPIPTSRPVDLAERLILLAESMNDIDPMQQVSRASGSELAALLEIGGVEYGRVRGQMIALQEELDWLVYKQVGLVPEDVTCPAETPHLALGERAFEIVLARRVSAGEEQTAWFGRHGSAPITEIPQHWPAAYRDIVQRRIELIEADPNVRVLERPEHKRRWSSATREDQERSAVREWLLERLEGRQFWYDAQGRPRPHSIAQLADEVSRDGELVTVLTLWEGRPDVPVAESLLRLLTDEVVPFLALYRYKSAGLDKRRDWELTWAMQRREDADENLAGPVPVPPKYNAADFAKTAYWRNRGKLDVPKERFILYPDAGRETDPTPVIGWAGWDHAQQSLALSTLIAAREHDGWNDDRLVPLIAGLAELQPWVEQWHSDVDPTFGVSLAAFCRQQLSERMQQVGMTRDQLAGWRPESATSRRARKPKAGSRS